MLENESAYNRSEVLTRYKGRKCGESMVKPYETALTESGHCWNKGNTMEHCVRKRILKVNALLVCEGCHNKVPATGWLRTTETYSQTVL